MTPFSNSRFNPISLSTSWRQMNPEIHDIAEFDELPGIFGIELQDRPNPAATDIYFTDTGWSPTDGFTGLTPLVRITTGNPSTGQYRLAGGNYSKVIMAAADDGKEVVVDYEGGGSTFSLQSLEAVVDDAIQVLALDNDPDWDSPSTTAGATQNAIVKYQKRVINLADDATINITAIFDTAKNGEYLIMRQNQPRTFVRFLFTAGTPSDADVLEAENFRVGDVDTFINLIQSTNDILFKNRLGSTLDFVVYRRDV
jgi:hypothetical protein